MNHLDLFSGIGGFSLGLQQAGIEPKWIGFSDIDKYANKVFKRRFPNAKELGSITDIQPKDLPRIDLVTFGFPCQDLSIAGKRGGLTANRSGLFFKAIEIIKAKKPKYFIFENVKGLFSSNEGKDFEIVLRTISDIGYDGEWQLCNTRWFLPQNRERIYFIGHIRGECRTKVFPIGEDDREVKKSREDGTRISAAPSREFGWKDISPTLCARDYKDPKLVKTGLYRLNQIGKVCNGDGGRVFDPNGIAPTLKAQGGGWGAKTGLYKVHTTQPRSGDPNKGCTGPLSREDGNTYCLDTGNTQAVEVMNCLTEATGNRASSSSEFISSVKRINNATGNIRRLTPTECERLQGFPDGWTEGQSDTQRYKQCGNAVSVPVVKAIMEKLYETKTN